MPMIHEQRKPEGPGLVVVANRLPLQAVEIAPDEVEWRAAPGGLVSALDPVVGRSDAVWIGWNGIAGTPSPPVPAQLGDLRVIDIELSAQELRDFYAGFCNVTLWPLLHDHVVTPVYRRRMFQAYRKVNERFADAALDASGSDSIVWIHDYQLMLVPEFVRLRRPHVRLGFFLHTPFPPLELFAQIPWRLELLRGMLGSDLIGFQTEGDAHNFLRCVAELDVADVDGRSVIVGERRVRIGVFPASIDSREVERIAIEAVAAGMPQELRESVGNPTTLIFGADRLDYTKGIDLRLRAYAELLHDGALDPEDTLFVQIASPSREELVEYQRIRDEIELIVGRTVGAFGTPRRPALLYVRQPVDRKEIIAWYTAAQVMLVTPLRDGMNLVAKEYVVARVHDDGALVLSEFAGAAHELGEAWMVNPYDVDDVKAKLLDALQVSDSERSRRMQIMRKQVFSHDAEFWCRSFLAELGASEMLDLRELHV